jgi:hypothetical protein
MLSLLLRAPESVGLFLCQFRKITREKTSVIAHMADDCRRFVTVSSS